jgi:hypothetical protein
MAVRVAATKRGAVTDVAVGPADLELGAFQRGDAALKACGLRARSAMCSMPEVFDAVSLSE